MQCLLRGLGILFIIASTSRPLAAEPALSPSLESLQRDLAEVLEETGTPGLGIALIEADRALWVGGIGKADRNSNRAVTADTFFRQGSISNSLVGLAALQLVEAGRLRLEDEVRQLAPEVEISNPWADTDPVRLVHLLEHTAGLDDLHPTEYAHQASDDLDLLSALRFHPHSRTVRWRPGTFHSYSNSGPALAAYIVEKRAGKGFEEYVRESILDPLRMERSGFALAPIRDRLAAGFRPGWKQPTPDSHILFRPSGALNSSPAEMANFVRMFLGQGTLGDRKILSADSLARMETPTTTLAARNGLQVGYGLGNSTSITRKFVFHGHGGAIDGYLSEFAYLPRTGRGYAVMINSADREAFERIRDLVRAFLTKDLAPPIPPTPEIPPRRLVGLAGFYQQMTPRAEITRALTRLIDVVRIDPSGGILRVRRLRNPSRDLIPVTDRRMRGSDDPLPTVAFIESRDDGLIVQGFSKALTGNYRRISSAGFILQSFLLAVVLMMMASSLLFSFIWIPRRLLGRISPQEPLSPRLLPLLAVLCLAVFVLLYLAASADPIDRLSAFTVWSFGLFASSLLFALFSLLGMFQNLRAARRPRNRAAWLHSLFVSQALLIAAIYLAYHGIIGIRTWSY
ncbi:MAG TPA: serine hydrolase domain-containing protein [Acidobacteriota bacterium]|nr:serine hydrolase domain-containing protein [Acidobacteriota bacterium]